jgi:phosphatidylglycerol lysyltransferase
VTAGGASAERRGVPHGGGGRHPRLAAWWRRISPFIGPALLALALYLLHRELTHSHYRDVVGFLRALPARRLLTALGLTAAGYLTLTCYDLLAVHHLGLSLPYRRIALASFVSYAFSNNVNATVSGMPLRVRFYTAWGLSTEDVARLIAFCILAFWVGFATLCGVTFTFFPAALPPSLHLPFGSERPLGAVALAAVGLYLAASAWRRQPLRIRGWEFPFPGPLSAAAQIAVSSLDWTLAGAVLYTLLPRAPDLSFPEFFGLFLLAQLVGLLSHSPGGLGVFDTLIVLLLTPKLPAAAILGALLAFRAIYYFLPLVLASVLLAVSEVARRREAVEQAGRALARWGPAVVPRVLSFTVFLGGVVLLVSGATPAVGSRLAWLDDLLPLPVIEVSHFLGSLAGAALLLLARGIQQRLDAAYHLTAALLGVGIAVSLLKGLDYEEAAILALTLAVLLPCRRFFSRRTSLIHERFTPGWITAIAAVLVASAWLGIFSFKHVEYSGELWWHFALRADAPRFLRAEVGAFALLAVVAAARLLRPAPPAPRPPTAGEIDAAAQVARSAPRSYAYLALLGDKSLLFNEARTAFVMYDVEGKSWVAMGDPVGPEDEATELAWRFTEICQQHAGWPVFYQVAANGLDRYVDMGLTLVKLGEEARVPLAGFSLAGHERKDLRQALRRGEREGLAFEVVATAEVAALLPVLAAVSDAWLAERGGGEKGFSLGFFQPDYLARLPIALVRRGEEVVAFANLWPGGGGEEMSIDLMRFAPSAPPGAMDFLFTSLIVWSSGAGYRWFNLGMAPLSGLDAHEGSPLWNRIGGLLYRHGEHFYNFQGLRHYKEKFAPVWEPRYLAGPGGLALPQVLTHVATLIGGGLRGVLGR